jgi:hypothetical protein
MPKALIAPLRVVAIAIALMVVPGCPIRRVQTEVQLPCGEELVKNGSFEDRDFTGVAETDLTDLTNCKAGSGKCLLNWTVGSESRTNPLAWFQSPVGILGVPADPDPGPSEKRFLNLSGTTHKAPFPPVVQTIPNLGAGRYQLQFNLGQSGGPNTPPERIGPVAVEVTINGVKIDGIEPTDPTRAPWQTRVLQVIHNGSDLTLSFRARQDQTKPFIGLDNVSLRELHPFSVCLRP